MKFKVKMDHFDHKRSNKIYKYEKRSKIITYSYILKDNKIVNVNLKKLNCY